MTPHPEPEAMVAQAVAISAVPIGRSYAAWTLGNGTEQPRRQLAATTLDEAVAQATPPPMLAALAKGGFPTFVVLETDDTAREGAGRRTLHVYAVKVRKEWRRFGDDVYAKQAAVPYAVKLGALPMIAFEPRRPFDAFVDCPANGRQPGEGRVIEVRAAVSEQEGEQ